MKQDHKSLSEWNFSVYELGFKFLSYRKDASRQKKHRNQPRASNLLRSPLFACPYASLKLVFKWVFKMGISKLKKKKKRETAGQVALVL